MIVIYLADNIELDDLNWANAQLAKILRRFERAEYHGIGKPPTSNIQTASLAAKLSAKLLDNRWEVAGPLSTGGSKVS